MKDEISILNRQIEDLKTEASKMQQGENDSVYRSLFEHNHAVMLLIDPETAEIKDANSAACSYYGWSREQLRTFRIDEINTLTRDEVFAQMQLARTEKRRNFFFKHRRADGSVRHVEVYSGPLTVRDQTLLYSIVHDITDRVQVQTLLAESERRLATLMANLPGMAYRCINDEFWTMTFVSEGCFELTGLPSDHLIQNRGKRYAELIHPEDRMMVRNAIHASLAKGERFSLTYRIHAATGEEKWVLEKGQGVFSSHGNWAAFEGFITDITKRRRTEEALRQSEEKFRLAFQTSPDSITLSRLSDGMYIDINEGFTKLTGHTRENVIGKTSLDLNIWADPRDRDHVVNDLRNKGCIENFKARFRRKDGKSGTGLMSARVLGLNQEDLILSITRDISERKQVENALCESENRYHQFFQATTEAVLVRSDEIIIDANPAARRIRGRVLIY